MELNVYLVELTALTEFINSDNCASLLVPQRVCTHEE